jgi:hypothetical protein
MLKNPDEVLRSMLAAQAIGGLIGVALIICSLVYVLTHGFTPF